MAKRTVFYISHSNDSYFPGGKWTTDIDLSAIDIHQDGFINADDCFALDVLSDFLNSRSHNVIDFNVKTWLARNYRVNIIDSKDSGVFRWVYVYNPNLSFCFSFNDGLWSASVNNRGIAE